jgi:hypothetical protein
MEETEEPFGTNNTKAKKQSRPSTLNHLLCFSEQSHFCVHSTQTLWTECKWMSSDNSLRSDKQSIRISIRRLTMLLWRRQRRRRRSQKRRRRCRAVKNDLGGTSGQQDLALNRISVRIFFRFSVEKSADLWRIAL